MPEPTMNLLELCVRLATRVEPRTYKAALLGGKVCAFVMEWARMMRETGNPDPTVEQWRAWANVPHRTAYRKQHEFRQVFGEWHDNPTPLAVHVNRADSSAAVPARIVPA